MGNLWLKIKVWSKITLFAAVVLYLGFFLFENANKPLAVWVWFGHEPETTLLQLLPSVFVGGVIGTLLMRMIFRTIKQIREMRARTQTAQLHKDLTDMKAKAAMLQTRDQASAPSNPVTPT
jgi:lysylphosphatidylglycerol synthetase-like protein (DUF2156 family)